MNAGAGAEVTAWEQVGAFIAALVVGWWWAMKGRSEHVRKANNWWEYAYTFDPGLAKARELAEGSDE